MDYENNQFGDDPYGDYSNPYGGGGDPYDSNPYNPYGGDDYGFPDPYEEKGGDPFGNEYEDNVYESRQPEFGDERGAYDRVGTTSKLSQVLEGVTSLNVLQGKSGREIISQEDRFKINVNAISRNLSDEGLVELTETDINEMLERTVLVPNLKYKNPTAYILGFIVTNGGVDIDKKKFDRVKRKVLPKIPDSGVEPEDVIRYSRFWKTL